MLDDDSLDMKMSGRGSTNPETNLNGLFNYDVMPLSARQNNHEQSQQE